MTNIGKAELNDNIAKQALEYLNANTVFAQLVARCWDDDVARCGGTVNIPVPGALTANDKVAGVGVTLQTLPTLSVTLDKHKEVSFPAEDIGRADVLSGYVKDELKIIAEAIDSDIANLYTGLTQSLDATGGLGDDDFRNAQMKLNAAKAPNSDRSFVLSANAEYELSGIEKFINRDYEKVSSQNGLDDAFVGSYMGFNCYMNQNVVFSTDRKNMAFHKNAFVLVSRPLAPARSGVAPSVMNEGGMGLRVTMGDNPTPQVTIDVLYGVGVLRSSYGVVVTTAVVA